MAGLEAMAMPAKGQVRAVPKNDMPAQRTFVDEIFGLVTERRKVDQRLPHSAETAEPRKRETCHMSSQISTLMLMPIH